MGIKIQKHKEEKKAKDKNWDISEILTKEITLFGKNFNNKKKEQWYNELNVLLRSGIDLKSGLELLAETQKKEQDAKMISEMLEELVNGKPFSEIIRVHKAFSDYEYHAIRIGEQTGKLAEITLELSLFYKRKNDLKREVISAMTYPVIVLITAVLVIIFMLKYVVPMFVDIFKQNRVELPGITKVVIQFSSLIQEQGIWILLLSIVLGYTIKYVFKNKKVKGVWGQIQLKLPIIGEYARKIYMAQFTQAIALLTSAKVPLVESIDLVSNMISFYPLQEGLKNANIKVVEGGKLSSAFAKHKIFDKKMVAMLRVAEETNQTEYIFERLNEQYNEQVKYQSQVISNVLNPILTILVGVLVGVILVAMYLPMFKLSSVIG